MNFKKYFSALLLLMVLMCCVGAINAVSDDAIYDDGLMADQNTELDSVSVDESNVEPVEVSQEDSVLEKTNQNAVASEQTSSKLSAIDQFKKDLDENHGTIYLTGDIKVSEPFILKEKTVIDGQGYTIDAQHKTNIFKSYKSLTIKNLVLINGKAPKGGAIYSNGDLNIDHCTFKNNLATECGGAIAIISGHLTLTNSHFESNSVQNSKASGYGGAVWIYKSSSKISKCTFKSNSCISKALKKHSKATKYKFSGGAITYSAGSSHTLTDCKFTGNKASNHGGSIFVINTKSLSINKCEFSKNRAVFEDGGAISFAGKKLTVTNSNFNNNLAYEDGGAIDSYSVTKSKIKITIKNCNFKSNTGYKCGGAIWMGVKTIYTVENSKFIKNKASSAGAIEAEDGSAKITKCTFTSNKAAKITSWVVKTKSGGHLAHSGGAILIKNKCKITKSVFKKNKAKWGKAVKIEGGKLTSKSNKGQKLK